MRRRRQRDRGHHPRALLIQAGTRRMQTAQAALWVLLLLVAMALVFDFMNGFHDAANSIATVVSTGVLKPTTAVLFAAFFNLVAVVVFQLSVAATIGKGIVLPGVVDTHIVFLSLIHISEPTRRTPISYAVFC